MGLDAFVRCRCFEDGRLNPGPIPFDDLFIDEDGYLWSHTLDAAYEKLGRQSFESEYGDLEREFEEWREHGACPHEDCQFCSEWVANISGWSILKGMFQAMGKDRAPTLFDMLPRYNGGSFPAAKAQQALEELSDFRKFAYEVGKEYHNLISEEKGYVVAQIPTDALGYRYPGKRSLRLEDGHLNVYEADKIVFRSKRFEKKYHKSVPGETMCKLIDLESGKEHVLLKGTKYVGFKTFLLKPDGIYHVNRSSDAEWAGWKADILERLLRASLETGNPIQWC